MDVNCGCPPIHGDLVNNYACPGTGGTQYIGARYVPLLRGPWNEGTAYTYLNQVSFMSNCYISKCDVPVGTLPTDTKYWMLIPYNTRIDDIAQELRVEMQSLREDVNATVGQLTTTIVGITNDFREEIQNKIDTFTAEAEQNQDDFRAEITSDISSFRTEVNSTVTAFRQETNATLEAFRNEYAADKEQFTQAMLTIKEGTENVASDMENYVRVAIQDLKQYVSTTIDTAVANINRLSEQITKQLSDTLAQIHQEMDELEASIGGDITVISSKVDKAVSDLEEAVTKIDEALETANTANTTAGEAKALAESFETQINETATKAEQAKIAAQEANNSANLALSQLNKVRMAGYIFVGNPPGNLPSLLPGKDNAGEILQHLNNYAHDAGLGLQFGVGDYGIGAVRMENECVWRGIPGKTNLVGSASLQACDLYGLNMGDITINGGALCRSCTFDGIRTQYPIKLVTCDVMTLSIDGTYVTILGGSYDSITLRNYATLRMDSAYYTGSQLQVYSPEKMGIYITNTNMKGGIAIEPRTTTTELEVMLSNCRIEGTSDITFIMRGSCYINNCHVVNCTLTDQKDGSYPSTYVISGGRLYGCLMSARIIATGTAISECRIGEYGRVVWNNCPLIIGGSFDSTAPTGSTLKAVKCVKEGDTAFITASDFPGNWVVVS